jgi:hypothetical protein
MKQIKDDQNQEEERKVVRTQATINSTYAAADVIHTLHGNGRLLDVGTLIDELLSRAKKIDTGDLKEIERMLFMQAKTLEYVFYDALKKLVDINMINQIEVFTEVAFKAQALSRKTLIALAELKHPRHATFIRQQNNAINQQVNNETNSNSRKPKKVANELLNGMDHAALDSRGTAEAVKINAKLETLESVDRS